MNQKVKVKRVRIIHAGPASGKTALMNALRQVGVRVLDTDDLLKEAVPSFYEVRLWRLTTGNLRSLDTLGPDKRKGEQVAPDKVISAIDELKVAFLFTYLSKKMKEEPDLLVFTNIYAKPELLAAFMDSSFLVRGRLPISFFVADPKDLADRSVSRSISGKNNSAGGIPLALTSRWLKEWKASADYFAHTGDINPGKFLSDVVDLSEHPLVGPDRWKQALALLPQTDSAAVETSEIEKTQEINIET